MSYLSRSARPTSPELDVILKDILTDPCVQELKAYAQHGGGSRYDHCLRVSRISYRVCNSLGLKSREAARAAMLHDFYFYSSQKGERFAHLRNHPSLALAEAQRHFELSKREKDIIVCHMWPITLRLPRYIESYIVGAVDTFCAGYEFFANSRARRSHSVPQPQWTPLPGQTAYERG